MTTIQTDSPSTPDATPPDVWREKGVHTVTGRTNSVLKIRLPGIGSILAAGGFPTHLVTLALLDLKHPSGAAGALRELLEDVLDEAKRDELLTEVKRYREYQAHLVSAALVDPPLTPEEVLSGEFPEDDLSMVAEIVQRLRNVDARGVRIGVEPLDRWATFHEEHGLGDPDGCEHCQRLVEQFSSIYVGAV